MHILKRLMPWCGHSALLEHCHGEQNILENTEYVIGCIVLYTLCQEHLHGVKCDIQFNGTNFIGYPIENTLRRCYILELKYMHFCTVSITGI